ncbi:MAG TPA: DMT family transporter [Acidimicrobiales bacterium]|nr:DMT family transporter [Acidimicrobiales bacterium]
MSRRGWVLFLAMGAIWGIPYLLIKVAIEDLSPAALVFARSGLATLLLVPLAAARRLLRPLLPAWKPLLLYTFVEICIPWVLLGKAEQQLSSSLTGLLVAAVPLVGAVLVTVTGEDSLGARRVAGLLLGFAGVAALVGFDVGASNAGAVAAVGGVAICYAVGPMILARTLSDLPSLGVVAGSLAITAVFYLPFGLASWPDQAPDGDTWLAVVALAVICTAVAFIVFFELIAEVGPARSTVITYLNPAVALVLGAVVLDEEITFTTGVGFALILVGSVLATSRDREAAPEPVPAPVGPGGRHDDEPTAGDVAACPVPEP